MAYPTLPLIGAQEGFSAEDIFADLLGGRGRRARSQPMRGEDFTVATTISFDEAARGGTRRVVVPTGDSSPVCGWDRYPLALEPRCG